MGYKSRGKAALAEAIERFRQTGIRLDRTGRFWHQGREVSHAGLRRALLRWIDRLDDGRFILRLDQHRYAYIDVEDAPLAVLSVHWRGERAFLAINDGTRAELDYASVRIGADNALYCAVRRGRLEARIATPAYYNLADRIVETEHGFALRAVGSLFPLGQRPAASGKVGVGVASG